MDTANYVDYGASHANANGSYTFVALDGYTYSNQLDLARIETDEHGYSW